MKYQITIRKTEKNENFAIEMAKFNEDSRNRNNYGMDKNIPTEYIVTDALICELTEDQFKKIKAESLKAFE